MCAGNQHGWLGVRAPGLHCQLTQAVSVAQLVPNLWVPVLNAAVTHVLACRQSKDVGLSRIL